MIENPQLLSKQEVIKLRQDDHLPPPDVCTARLRPGHISLGACNWVPVTLPPVFGVRERWVAGGPQDHGELRRG